MKRHTLKRLYSTTALVTAAILCAAPGALAQSDAQTEAEEASAEVIVITGSRIRRSVSSTPAPVSEIDAQSIEDRGYLTAADALNDIPSMAPQLNQADGSGNSSGSGQQYPALFGLGSGRTLSLVNGRRFVTTSSGLGDAQVDANIIPTGLIERVEIVQGGGAAVYGSDAIAGVVNYILVDDFEGLELDLQYGDSWEYNDYAQPSIRLTGGTNFAEDRGNVAFNIEWSDTPSLQFSDRPRSNLARLTQGNPLDTGPNDGIPSVSEVIPAHFWNFNTNGVIYSTPAPPPNFLARLNGSPIQFGANGDVIAYDPGNILGIPFAEGGDGFRYSDLAGLRTGVERFAANVITHYDVSPTTRLTGEFMYSSTEAEERPQGVSRTVLNSAASGSGPIMFTVNNPFLTDNAIASLTQVNPGFAFGAPMWMSKHFDGQLFPEDKQTHSTETWRAMLGAEGEFAAGDRDFYWTVSGAYAGVEGEIRSWGAHNAHFNNALNAVRNGADGIVCAINADADASNDDPNCAPLNPFGFGNISTEAQNYVSVRTGEDFSNTQFDFLATLGSSLLDLPAGPIDYVLAYEHRYEKAEFTPLEANRLGLVGTGDQVRAEEGDYKTDELSVELLAPLMGGDFTLPFVQELEFSGSFRYVDNSITDAETVWGAGLRWRISEDLMVRASRSRNFRAPTLTQLFAPTTVTLGSSGIDPCDADRINAGPNPAIRRANCEAEWAANPNYGDLATFQNPAENFTLTSITSGGNRDLKNEVSDTWTYGFVFEPSFIPGLTLTVDRIEIDLTDGLSAFTNEEFMATCYDSAVQPADICAAFTRLAVADGTTPAGTVVTGRSTTVNAGEIRFEGEVYYAQYEMPLDSWFTSFDPGQLSLGLQATHTSLLTTSATGSTFIRTDGTDDQPEWVGRFDAVWTRGPLRMTYQAYYLDDVLAAPGANIENNPNPVLESNITHDVSGQYQLTEDLSLRAGVINFTDEEPSYPSLSYGDILGRRWFVGANYRF